MLGKISLWTGDNDILSPILEKAKGKDWEVEVWSFKAATSAVMEKFPEANINHLDAIYHEIAERKTGWKPNTVDKIPAPTSSFRLRYISLIGEPPF